MLGFYKKILLFIVVFAVLNAVLHFVFLEVVNKSSIIQKNDEKFYIKANDHIRILFIGDSHVNAIQDDMISEGLKFNSSGESYIQSYYKLKYLTENDIRIDNIVVPYDLHSFSSYRSNRIINDLFWVKYIDYFELAELKQDNMYLGKWWLANFASYSGKGDDILEYIQKVHGFYSLKKQEVESVINRVDYHFKGSDPIDKDLVFYFLKIAEICNANDISLVLLKYPVSFEYYNLATAYIDPEAYYTNLDTILAKSMETECVTIDLQDIFFERPEYFFDADHLNYQGSFEFTELIKERLQLP